MDDDSNIRTAIRLAEHFFAAIDTRQWDAAAEMVDAELAVRFRETELASVIAWARHHDAIIASRQSGEGMVGWSAPPHVNETLLAQYGIYHADPLSVDVIRLRPSGDEWKVDPTSLTFTLASTHLLLALDELAGNKFLIDGA